MQYDYNQSYNYTGFINYTMGSSVVSSEPFSMFVQQSNVKIANAQAVPKSYTKLWTVLWGDMWEVWSETSASAQYKVCMQMEY